MQPFVLHVTGDFACFTRPEMKVERVSYDVITPSAARAIFESILWKPAIRWQIRRIDVLAPIRWTTLRRNELAGKLSLASVHSAMRHGAGQLAQYIEEERQQRASLLLRDVAYRLYADFSLTERAGPDDSLVKFAEMFRRRASRGQCVNQPYLGCREFAADVSLASPDQAAPPCPPALRGEHPLGWMLYDLDFTQAGDPRPCFYRPVMRDGVIHVPDWQSEEVLG